MKRLLLPILLGALALGLVQTASADTRMLRYPDIHGDQVVFAYAGDLWLASTEGDAVARRLTSHPGLELYPRFSPDGSKVAFTGQYRGDEQVYVISVSGGEPQQLTWYPTAGPLPARWGTDHQVYGWTPDGKHVLFRSMRNDFNNRRLYQVAVDGGLPEVLPMPRAGSGDFSPDGRKILYSPLFRDFRTWKRYEGGWAQNLYVWDLGRGTSQAITTDRRTERDPVWLESGMHFVSDRSGTLNLYAVDEDGNWQQRTDHKTWDIKWASGDGVSRIVYEIEGRIGLFDTRSNEERMLSIDVPDDHVRRSARRIAVSHQIEDFNLSPGGERLVLAARGDVFTVPAEHGITRNLTQRGDAHDREAAWSPDGEWIAFVSDRSGEEQLYVVPQGGGEARALTEFDAARLYRPVWAPDSESIAIHDQRGNLHVVSLKGRSQVAARGPHGAIDEYEWSPDSAWLAFSRLNEDGAFSIYLWSADSGRVRMVTDSLFHAFGPVFSADGKHLYFRSDREFAPQIGAFEWNYIGDRETGIYALALSGESGNPFGVRNDEVAPVEEDEAGPSDEAGKDGDEGSAEDSDAPPAVEIDFDGLADRVIRVPIEADNIAAVMPMKDKLLYVTSGPFYYGRNSDQKTTLHTFDFKERESKVLKADIQDVRLSLDGKYLVVRTGKGFERLEIAKPKEGKPVPTNNLVVHRAPAEEWAAIFDEVWRRFRDYFYVPNMHGYDWEGLREQYRPLVAHVSTREDLNTLIGEMIAELNVGHAYVSGGDLQAGHRSSVSLLGARFEADRRAGRYRIGHIYAGHNEEPKYHSPLTVVGVEAGPGDYVLAIDGKPLTTDDNPYRLLSDRGNQPVELTVADRPRGETRQVLVEPVRSESNLVYLEWVQANRKYVAAQTDGRVGYLHIPDMGSSGIYEFIKWFYPQLRKQGLVVDVRGNGGGNVSQMILRRLMQNPLAFGYQANSEWIDTYPATAFNGPMVSLISEDSASDGDIFPYFFRELGLGPLIGKRTWGGVVGISGRGPLLDGGDVFVPEFADAQPGKGWVIEGEGVTPDIEVDNDPSTEADEQLDRGIAEILDLIRAQAPNFLPKPAPPVKTQ